VQRLQKILEDANVKLANVVSDILGVSGRAILEAIGRGESDPRRLADLGHGRLKASKAELAEALEGRVREHHRFLVRLHLSQIDGLNGSVTQVESRIEELLLPFADLVRRLKTIPGIQDTSVAILLAEIGADMSVFPSADHLVSWTALSPRQDMSNGKRRSSKTRKGKWAKTMLVQAAWSAVRHKEPSYLTAKFHRVRSRRGSKKAIVAVAAAMLTAAYHIIKDGTEYQDLGPDFLQRRTREKHAFRLVQRLQQMGYIVDLQSAA
jgi:transposase